mmetsp:Transcript_8334/g.20551  ORF Transcript_8334/g.20551 Transcript_8334/m.20551 type:complete len:235 (-) Transcript_8334:5697-6401(-)
MLPCCTARRGRLATKRMRISGSWWMNSTRSAVRADSTRATRRTGPWPTPAWASPTSRTSSSAAPSARTQTCPPATARHWPWSAPGRRSLRNSPGRSRSGGSTRSSSAWGATPGGVGGRLARRARRMRRWGGRFPPRLETPCWALGTAAPWIPPTWAPPTRALWTVGSAGTAPTPTPPCSPSSSPSPPGSASRGPSARPGPARGCSSSPRTWPRCWRWMRKPAGVPSILLPSAAG